MSKKERTKKKRQAAGDKPDVPPGSMQPHWKKSLIRDYFESIVIAVVLALFVRTFVVQTFRIPSSSMEDTLLVGDHILVNKFSLAPHAELGAGLMPYDDIERNDVIVFKFPRDPRKDYIKRVIGLPGDEVELRRGELIINGEPTQEASIYLKNCEGGTPFRDPAAHYRRTNSDRYSVPEGRYLVMGDNRNCSYDSRGWGTVPRTNVKGKALVIYWSFDGRKGEPEDMGEKVDNLKDVLVNFIGKTRWNRTFKVVR